MKLNIEQLQIWQIYKNRPLTLVLRRGGGDDYIHLFLTNFFIAQTRSFQGCLRVWSKETKPLDTNVNSEIWLYFTMQYKFPKNIYFVCGFS